MKGSCGMLYTGRSGAFGLLGLAGWAGYRDYVLFPLLALFPLLLGYSFWQCRGTPGNHTTGLLE